MWPRGALQAELSAEIRVNQMSTSEDLFSSWSVIGVLRKSNRRSTFPRFVKATTSYAVCDRVLMPQDRICNIDKIESHFNFCSSLSRWIYLRVNANNTIELCVFVQKYGLSMYCVMFCSFRRIIASSYFQAGLLYIL